MPTVFQRYGARRGAAASMANASRAGELSAPVVLMVSGGADSTALLLMACTGALDIADGRGPARIARERLHVLHVNHHLRGEASDGDEAFVRELCAREGLPLCVEHASFANLGGQNLEAAARDVRYAAARRYVRELCAQTGAPRSAARILTAHTASDRAETFFMNAIKGSGAAGLSSIPRRRNIIVRPLLDMTHADLIRYLQVAGQSWREDESNQDTGYLRNFVRHRLMPVAGERNANVARNVSAACDILGDEDAFMSQLASTALRSCVRRRASGLIVLDASRLAAAEVAIARRVVRLAVRELDGEARLEMRHVEAVLSCVAMGEGSVTLPSGIDARIEFGTLALRTPAEREGATAGWLAIPGRLRVAAGTLEAQLLEVPAGADPIALAREASTPAREAPARMREASPGPCETSTPACEAATASQFSGQGLSPATSQDMDRELLSASLRDAPSCASSATVLIDAAALGYATHELPRLAEDQRWGASGSQQPDRDALRLWVDVPAAGDMLCPFGMHGRSKKLSDLLNEAHVPLAERAVTPVLRTTPGGAIVWAAPIRLDDRFKCTATSKVLVKLTFRHIADVR